MTNVDLRALEADMKGWRHDLHAHPEFGFEETRTAQFVADRLRSFGFDDVAEGIGGTGIVGTIKRGRSNRAIALRADMDALRITEEVGPSHCSRNAGTMHACGHDGHTAMLLGAARLLSAEGGFDGTLRFIFQPAEEWGRGAVSMIENGLFERFPFEEIYGVHNMPGLPAGHFETKAGALMSAEDVFEISLEGQGGHASRPQGCNETLVAGCALVMSLQTIVSRRLDPADTAVVSVTEFITDGTRNALPGKVRILGDCRSFDPAVSAQIERQMRIIAEGAAAAHNVRQEVQYSREFVPLINDEAATEEALAAAVDVFPAERITRAERPITASEDFARFLERVPGCFAFIGNGEDSAPLHNPRYDFNDSNLVPGARYFAAIARRRLPEG